MTVAARAGISVVAGPPAPTRPVPGWFALLAAALVTVAVLAIAGPIVLSERTEDWRAYEQAAARLVAGEPLYVWQLADPSQEYYLYPPPMAAVWSLGLSWQGLLALKIAALAAGLAALARGPMPWRPVVAGALVALGLASAPVLHDLVLSNVMVLYVGAVALLLARPRWLGAIPLGALLAIAAKPAIGPVLLWLLICRPRQLAMVVGAALLTSLPFLLLLGPGRYVEYLGALPSMAVLNAPFTGNVGLSAASRELGYLGVAVAYAWAALAALRLDPRAAAAIAVSMTLLAQPTIGFNYGGLLVPAVVVLWALDRRLALAAAVVAPLVALLTPIVAAIAVAGAATLASPRARGASDDSRP